MPPALRSTQPARSSARTPAVMFTANAHPVWLAIAAAGLLLFGCSGRPASGVATLDPVAARGKALFNGTCASCHATTDDDVVVGPSLAGVAERAGTRVPGEDADTYMRQSIVDPRAYTVEGFPDNMMPINYAQVFTPEDIDAILAYLHTLRK